jgi:hypothetical protein
VLIIPSRSLWCTVGSFVLHYCAPTWYRGRTLCALAIPSSAPTAGSGGPISEGDLLAQPLMVLSGTTVRDHILRSTSATTVTELAAQMLGAGVSDREGEGGGGKGG